MQPVHSDGIAIENFSATPTGTRTQIQEYSKIEAFYELTKPGITKMVVLSGAAGYYLGLSHTTLDYFSRTAHILNFFLTIVGIALVSAGSCVLNNYIERNYDSLMKRTANRPIPSGKISPKEALVFGITLSLLGIGLLCFVNMLTVLLAIATLVCYVAIYTPMKRRTTLSLLVGGIPGALPTLGGWTAVNSDISLTPIFLFLILFFWQMPHFLSLSWIYKQDYENGGFKMLCVVDKTGKRLAQQTVGYVVILFPITIMLTFLNATGIVYAVGSVILCSIFLYFSLNMLKNLNIATARKALLSSYLYLIGVITLIFADKM